MFKHQIERLKVGKKLRSQYGRCNYSDICVKYILMTLSNSQRKQKLSPHKKISKLMSVCTGEEHYRNNENGKY